MIKRSNSRTTDRSTNSRSFTMKSSAAGARTVRRDRLIHEHLHDPYKLRLKLTEPTACPGCGAVYHRGRWRWGGARPDDARRESCQACHRIHDRYPAGIITLSGSFVQRHRDEILALVRHHEEVETNEHPLHRIIDIEERPESIVIRTTDIHMPRRVGEALRSAYKGQLDVRYEEEAYFIRVDWKRDAGGSGGNRTRVRGFDVRYRTESDLSAFVGCVVPGLRWVRGRADR